MRDFSYHRPTSIEDAVALLRTKDSPKLLAGGMTLLPVLKNGLADPSDLIDLAAIPHLRGIHHTGDTVTVGAMTRHADVASSPVLQATIPALSALAAQIGDPQVRNRGTLGGSIANSDPAADYPSAVVALDAAIVTNKRRIAADDFFRGMFETSLELDEIVTSIAFPVATRAIYLKQRHPVSRFALVGVFAAERNRRVRLAVTGAGPCVFRATEMEEALSRRLDPDVLESIHIEPDELNDDFHASREYRAHLVKVMARRAVRSMAG